MHVIKKQVCILWPVPLEEHALQNACWKHNGVLGAVVVRVDDGHFCKRTPTAKKVINIK